MEQGDLKKEHRDLHELASFEAVKPPTTDGDEGELFKLAWKDAHLRCTFDLILWKMAPELLLVSKVEPAPKRYRTHLADVPPDSVHVFSRLNMSDNTRLVGFDILWDNHRPTNEALKPEQSKSKCLFRASWDAVSSISVKLACGSCSLG